MNGCDKNLICRDSRCNSWIKKNPFSFYGHSLRSTLPIQWEENGLPRLKIKYYFRESWLCGTKSVMFSYASLIVFLLHSFRNSFMPSYHQIFTYTYCIPAHIKVYVFTAHSNTDTIRDHVLGVFGWRKWLGCTHIYLCVCVFFRVGLLLALSTIPEPFAVYETISRSTWQDIKSAATIFFSRKLHINIL